MTLQDDSLFSTIVEHKNLPAYLRAYLQRWLEDLRAELPENMVKQVRFNIADSSRSCAIGSDICDVFVVENKTRSWRMTISHFLATDSLIAVWESGGYRCYCKVNELDTKTCERILIQKQKK